MKAKLFVFSMIVFVAMASVPSFLKADEVYVPSGPKIYDFIMGDTTGTGERAHPGRIYKLKRDSIYIFTDAMQVNFDLYLIGDEDNPDDPTRPPMLVQGILPDGSMVGNLINLVGDNIKVELKNLVFQGYPLDANYRNAWFIALAGDGAENVRLKINQCVFTGWNYAAMDLYALNGLKMYITDCVYRNLVQPVHPFGGQSVGTWCAPDSLVYVNNTFFNTSAYIVLPEEGVPCNYIKFDHNTIFTTIIDPIHIPYVYNAEITNNIFYGILAFGQSHREVQEGWFGPDGKVVGIINLDTMDTDLQDAAGVTEADRKIILRNNVWYNPQKIVDYWTAYKDSIPVLDANGDTTGWDVKPLAATKWMNETTQAMFDDSDNYPSLDDINTMEDDPQFDASVASVVDSVVSWVAWWRAGLGWDADEGPIRQYDFNPAHMFDMPWPLPEKLTYSNQTLLTAADNSFPVGDLNWYPDAKNEWITTDIGADENMNVLKEYALNQNYPNPFNPTTKISFVIPKSGKTTLTVYNVLGQKIATLVNERLNAGEYQLKFDAKGLSSGMYYYKLESGDFVSFKKMVLLK